LGIRRSAERGGFWDEGFYGFAVAGFGGGGLKADGCRLTALVL
jgi:hypothetical protein